jgi:hypothetical protein
VRLPPSGYFGFGSTARLEVVDFARNSLRTIKVPLPDTQKRRGCVLRGVTGR